MSVLMLNYYTHLYVLNKRQYTIMGGTEKFHINKLLKITTTIRNPISKSTQNPIFLSFHF